MTLTMYITERVQRILSKQFSVAESDITPDKTTASLHGDSLDWVEVCMAIEIEFGIEIDDDKWRHVSTVQNIVDHVARYTREA